MPRQDITRKLGKIIRQNRRQMELSQEQLAFAAELNRNYISLVELGTSSPTVDSLTRIATALGKSGSSLLAQAETLQTKPAVRRVKR